MSRGVAAALPARLDRLSASLRGEIGGRTAAALEKGLGLRTVGDLLDHVPRRYLPTGELTPIDELTDEEFVTIVGEVVAATTRQLRNRKGSITDVDITDGHAVLRLTFFNRPWLSKTLHAGYRGLFSGKLSTYKGRRQLVSPEYAELELGPITTDEHIAEGAGIPALIPVYPATAGARSWVIWTSVQQILDTLTAPDVPDPLPVAVREALGLPGRFEALVAVHRPATADAPDAGLHRLRFEEAFVLQTGLLQRRHEAMSRAAVVRRPNALGLLAAFDERLPFTLTAGQVRVGEEIGEDMVSGAPMQRLLQGEVGSGKTLVALRAMLTVVDTGGQAALLAPTEVLAGQHHRTVAALLGDLAQAGMLGGDARGTRVALLTGSLPAAARRAALLDIASGAAGIVVGTHALLSDVGFADLGLVVVDEQHRFGVEQRDALRMAAEARGTAVPHLLVMTATPIPRTVAMTVFGDLDVSSLNEIPAGRADVATHVVPLADHPTWLARAWSRIREEVDAGGQAFVVCPRIGEVAVPDGVALDAEPPDLVLDEIADDEFGLAPDVSRLPSAGVVDVIERLTNEPVLAGLRLAALHGRQHAEIKDATMQAFAAGDVDVLVATTVIEVGVDVPNASVMVVLDADRFGVSQLHQLRGRIGRGARPGVCLLVTSAPPGAPARARVDAVAQTRDGLALARLDLEARREGDVLGAAQSGRRSSLRLLRVLRDEDLIVAARELAVPVVADDPDLERHPVLREALRKTLRDGRDEFIDRA